MNIDIQDVQDKKMVWNILYIDVDNRVTKEGFEHG